MKSIKYIYKTVLLLCFCTLATNVMAQATKVRPNTAVGDIYSGGFLGIGAGWSADNSSAYSNVVDLDANSLVKLRAHPGAAATIAERRQRIYINFNSVVNPSVSGDLYVKIGTPDDPNLLGNLLGGTVGDLVNGVTNLLTGDASAKFKLTNTSVPNGDSVTFDLYNSSFRSSSNAKLVQFPDGEYYLKITPTGAFNRLEIELSAPGLLGLLSGYVDLDVYDVFYYTNIGECDLPVTTSFSGTKGLLAVAAGNPVTDPNYAIDNDIKSYSEVGVKSVADASLAAEVSQFFYLPKPIDNSIARFRLEVPVGLLDVGLFYKGSSATSEIIFYNGQTVLESFALDTATLNLNVAGLLDTNTTEFTVQLAPRNTSGQILPYDKVELKVKDGLINLDLLGGSRMKVYDVSFVNATPIDKEVCSKEFVDANNIRTAKFKLSDIIEGYSPSKKYIVINEKDEEIAFDSATVQSTNNYQPLGTYYIKGIDATGFCDDRFYSFRVKNSDDFRLTGKTSVVLNIDTPTYTFLSTDFQVFTNDSPTVNVTGYTIDIFNENTLDTVTGSLLTFDKIGTYNYFVKASKGDCDIVKRITVYVYDADGCDYRYVQNSASKESAGTVSLLGIPLGGTSESARAIDTDLSTHGSVFNVVSLLGIGTTYQNLYFTNGADTSTNKIITAGTPVTIKLGQDFGVAQVIGGITVQALDNAGNRIGKLLSIGETDLLNVLAGDNVFEYTFVPQSDSGTAVAYSGVRINLGSVLGVGNNLKVYGAYIDERKSLAEAGICEDNLLINGAEVGPATNQQDVQLRLNRTTKDVLYGTQDLGLGVATALSSVVYPYLAADAIDSPTSVYHGTPDYATYALFNTSVSALNRMTLTVKFRDIARPGDKVRVVLGKDDASILDLNVLGGALTAQRYMGNVAIGDPYVIQSTALVELDLLGLLGSNGFNKTIIEIPGIGAPFDRVELGLNSLVNVDLLAPKLRVYDVSVVPYFEFDSGTTQETTLLCTSAPFEVEKLDPCFTYDLSYAYATGDSSTVVRYIDIDSSTVQMVRNNEDVAQYKLTTSSKIALYNSDDNLYLKVVTRRAGCIYGNANYLKVKVASCGAISNPMIRTRLKTN